MAPININECALTRHIFMKAVAVIYMFAFSSLYFQIPGLYGEKGLLPAHFELKKEEKSTVWESFKNKPTLLWLASPLGLDRATCMEAICLLGTLVSGITAMSRRCRNAIWFGLLWFLYFSVYQAGQTFLWFQWDILLLETGFITIILSDLDLGFQRSNNCHRLGMWLVKWLLFRLMFASGVVKLTSRCPTWWGLTALNYHYESQCIPTPLAWYAHQLPEWFQKLSVALTFVIEIGLPFLFFSPVRWLRLFSFYSQVFLQVLIILTGNYNFFNLLTVALCVSLLDDGYFGYRSSKWNSEEFLVSKGRKAFSIFLRLCKTSFISFCISAMFYYIVELFSLKIDDVEVLSSQPAFNQRDFNSFLRTFVPVSIALGTFSLILEILLSLIRSLYTPGFFGKLVSIFRSIFYSGVVVWVFCVSLVPYTDIEQRTQESLWPVIFRWHRRVDHLQINNPYGLFRSMTGVGGRPEIIIEGSNSLQGPWKEYEFMYKPGKLDSPMTFCIPHQPRLDWQMWFAALGSYQHNPWFIRLIDKLLEGEKVVLALIRSNPFPKNPPKFIRSTLYLYHYTLLPKNTSGFMDGLKRSRNIRNWWWRDSAEEYTPALEKNNQHVKRFLQHFGLTDESEMDDLFKGSLCNILSAVRETLHCIDPTVFMISLAIAAYIPSILKCVQ